MSEQIRVTELGPDDQLILFTGNEGQFEMVAHLAERIRTEPTLIIAGGELEVIIRRRALRADRQAEDR